MNFQRQGNERKLNLTENYEETKYYDRLYMDRTKKFLDNFKKIA